jgi:branched-chain amino acid transport system permease protein
VSSESLERRQTAQASVGAEAESQFPTGVGVGSGQGLLRISLAVVLAIGLFSIPWLGPSYRFLSVAISSEIAAVSLYGLSLLFGQAGILSLAQAALMGVGSYTAAILAVQAGLGFWAAMPFAMLMAALIAGVLGLPSLRVGGHQFIIITFAFGALFSIVLTNGGSFTGAASGLDVGRVGSLLGVKLDKLRNYYLVVTVVLMLSILATHLISASPYGRILRAIRENEVLARAVGIRTGLHKLGAFMLGGVFAGIAGVLQAYFLGHISPTLYGGFPSVYLALMVMLGGPRLLYGPLVGAAIVSFLPEILNVDPVDARIAYGTGLIVVIMAMPGGVTGGIVDLLRWVASRAQKRRRAASAIVSSE